jgi:hypothetical protein
VLGLAASVGGCFSDPTTPPTTPAAQTTTGDDAAVSSQPTVTIVRGQGSPISPFAFGQNYWDWVDYSNSGVTGLTGTEPLVTALQLNVIRAGGNNNDTNSPSPFDTNQIDKFVAYCRTVGAEPILQVPLVADGDGGAATAQNAADMVTYANGTMGYGIKYWEIGNEPDLYPTDLDAGFPVQNAADYCTQFSAYATAMRAANAAASDGGVALALLGPELSYKYVAGNDWLTPFLDGCKDDVDIVTVHRYPFSGPETSVQGALTDVRSFQSTVNAVAAIVKGHARPGTPFGITEANISYAYALSSFTASSLIAAPGTFYAALWTADVLGAALENNLWTLAFWNIGETSETASVLGFITADQPDPAYYAQWLVSSNFRGQILAPTGVPAGFSVYASYDATAGSTSVLVLNKTTASSGLTLAVDTLAPQALVFPALSMSVVHIPDSADGGTHVLRYTADLADAGTAPQTIQ